MDRVDRVGREGELIVGDCVMETEDRLLSRFIHLVATTSVGRQFSWHVGLKKEKRENDL